MNEKVVEMLASLGGDVSALFLLGVIQGLKAARLMQIEDGLEGISKIA